MLLEVRIYSLSQVVGQCVIVMEELHGPRLLPIWIGLYEGGAIGMSLAGQKFPRPLTHDLFMLLAKELGASLEKVIITKLMDSTFYAELHFKYDGKNLVIDARPSDSIALAVRANCPMFIADEVFAACPEILKPISEEEVGDFKKKLQNMSPEDFFRDLQNKDKEEKKDSPDEESQG